MIQNIKLYQCKILFIINKTIYLLQNILYITIRHNVYLIHNIVCSL